MHEKMVIGSRVELLARWQPLRVIAVMVLLASSGSALGGCQRAPAAPLPVTPALATLVPATFERAAVRGMGRVPRAWVDADPTE